MKSLICAGKLWDGEQLLDEPLIVVEDGQVTAIKTRSAAEEPVADERIEFTGAILAPAFFDVHIHGGRGHDAMEGSADAARAIGGLLAAHGTANFLATTVTAPVEVTLTALAAWAQRIELDPCPGRAQPLGIHLEGPFLSREKRGVHPEALLREPDIALFDRFYEAAGGHLRLMTVAPELDGALELIAHARQHGVAVSLGHSAATLAETRAAIAAGATSATHTFNAMRSLDHREPGILGAVLDDGGLFAEMIVDGVHTAEEIVRLWWRMKGPERALLMTDAMSATGCPDGSYLLGGIEVEVADGRALADGRLAGSLLTLDRALTNLIAFTGAELTEALPAVTRNPALLTGLEAGRLFVGGPANLVALEEQGRLLASFVYGARVTPD